MRATRLQNAEAAIIAADDRERILREAMRRAEESANERITALTQERARLYAELATLRALLQAGDE